MKIRRLTKGRGWRPAAFTLVEMLILAAVILLLAGLFLPLLARSRIRSKRINCVNNAKQVGLAFRIFSGDHGDQFPMSVSTNQGGTLEFVNSGFALPHFRVMSNELGSTRVLICPSDVARTNNIPPDFGVLASDRSVSYFVGVDANEMAPQRILTGDRNLTADGQPVGRRLVLLATNQTVGWTAALHHNAGNIGFADGSVQQYTSERVAEPFTMTGLATNRLAVP